jgi:nucleotide-binding universal stress UspA family protein
VYRRIIVPLDGTRFGDQALPTAIDVALRTGASLELVHVQQGANRPALEEKAAELELRYPVDVRTRILEGNTSEAILAEAGEIVADLVVMATHARTGLDRVRNGSLAHALLSALNVPTLCVHPLSQDAALVTRPMRRILVPLDGSTFSEQILDPLAPLAQALNAQLTLLHVVAPRPILASPADDAFSLLVSRDQALAYLQSIAERWRGHIREPVLLALEDRRPPALIAALLAAGEYDAVAMATHGRGGLSALLAGSVANDVLRLVNAPVILYRPRAERLPLGGIAGSSLTFTGD